MFTLLADPPNVCSARRQDIAARLLAAPEATLEATSRKLRKRCQTDLAKVANDGQLPQGSCLHAVLIATALNLKLDAGSLESLNSMIKCSLSQANNTGTSLELLSSRVNMRKTLTLETGGSAKLKDVRPVAEAIARTSAIYQGTERFVLDTPFRWKPPEPRALTPNDITKHNPGMVLTSVQQWAIKYNRSLLRAVHAWRKQGSSGAGLLLAVLFEDSAPTDGGASQPQMFFVAEVCGRSAWTLVLRRQCLEQGQPFSYVTSCSNMGFLSSLDAILHVALCGEGYYQV